MRASFEFILTPEEFSAAVIQRGLRYPLPRWMRPGATLLNIVLFGAFGFLGAMAFGHRTVPGKAVLAAALVGAIAALISLWVSHRATVISLRASTFMAGTRRTLALEDGGVRISSAHEDTFHPWTAFAAVEQHGEVVNLLLDAVNFQPVPFSAFESDAEREEFVSHVAARIGKPPAAVAVPPAIAATMDEPRHVPRRRAVARRMLLDAIRLAFFLDVPP
ncbi:MAG TPA: YcxB family protein, partial [Usitatibacter sp.]|nr:YcxB family protein [Usitatibacter sp.]